MLTFTNLWIHNGLKKYQTETSDSEPSQLFKCLRLGVDIKIWYDLQYTKVYPPRTIL
jgi:hypothetical protein